MLRRMSGVSNVYLIGPMGSGKTAVGRQLARLLHLDFYDSDVEIERRTGVDIPYIFEKEGEAGFREREREVIEPCGRLASAGSPLCGGGLIRPCPARPLPGTRSGSSESKGVRDDGAPRRVCSLVLAGGVFPDLTANAPP